MQLQFVKTIVYWLHVHIFLSIGIIAWLGSNGPPSARAQSSVAHTGSPNTQSAVASATPNLVDRYVKALVHIDVAIRDKSKPERGTGFIIKRVPHGVYILTAYHVLHPVNETVTGIKFFGDTISSKTIRRLSREVELSAKEDADMSLLFLAGDSSGPIIEVGHADSELRFRLGASFLGYPESMDPAPSPQPAAGALTWSTLDGHRILMTDAVLDPGMSGGPVLSSNGLAIGLISIQHPKVSAGPRRVVRVLLDFLEEIKEHTKIDIVQSKIAYGLRPLPQPLIEHPKGKELDLALSETSGTAKPCVLVSGAGGMGKTTLATKVALERQEKGKYVDGVFFFEVNEQSEDQVITNVFLAITQLPARGKLEELLMKISEYVQGRDMLIILDNISTDILPSRLLGAIRGASIILTSRYKKEQPPITNVIDLGGIDDVLGAKFLNLKYQKHHLPPPEQETLRAISKVLGGHILALDIAGSILTLREMPPKLLLEQLKEKEQLLALRRPGNPAHEPTIASVLAITWERLSPQERKVFVALGQVGEAPLVRDIATYIAGELPAKAEEQIDQLTLWCLVNVIGETQSIFMHPIIYAWAQKQGNLPEFAAEVRDARRRFITIIRNWSTKQKSTSDWVPDLSVHLETAQKHARLEQDYESVFAISNNWNWLLYNVGEWPRLITLLRNSYSMFEGDSSRSRSESQCNTSEHLADVYQRQGLVDKAIFHYQICVAILSAGPQKINLDYYFATVGRLYLEMGRLDDAEDSYLKGLKVLENIERSNIHSQNLRSVFSGLIILYGRKGEIANRDKYQAKLEELEKADPSVKLVPIEKLIDSQIRLIAAIKQKRAPDEDLVYNVIHLADLYLKAKQHEKALEHYTEALVLSKNSRQRPRIASCHIGLAITHERLKQFSLSLENYNLAIMSFQDINDRKGEASALDGIGVLYFNKQDFHSAHTAYLKSKQIYQELKMYTEMEYELRRLQLTAEMLKDNSLRRKYLLESLNLSRQADHGNIPYCLNDLGNLEIDEKNITQACAYYAEAFAVSQAQKDEKVEAAVKANQASFCATKGKSAQGSSAPVP